MTTRKLEIKIVGDDRDIQRVFGKTSKSANGWSSTLVSAGKKAALGLAAGGVAAAGLGTKLTMMAGDAAEVESKFQVTFGREMPAMVKELDKFSEATGASRFQLRQQAADMGALLVPMIGSRKEASGLSMQMVKLATDLSSFNNIPVADALEKIRAGLVGEAEPLRSVGVLLSDAAVKQEAYRSGIARTGAELTEQQKVQARANIILQQTKLAQGDATRTADSFTNQLRRLRNSVSDTGTELGLKLLPHVTNFLQKVNREVVPAVEDWAVQMRDELKPRLDAISDWASDHKDDFSDLFEEAIERAGEFAEILGKIGKAADGTAKAAGGWDVAFNLLLGGAIASNLAKVLTKLAGPAGKGGIVGALMKIKGLGPTLALTIALSFILDERSQPFLDAMENNLRRKLHLDGLLGLVGESGGGAATVQGENASDKAAAGSAGAGMVTVNPRRLPAGQGRPSTKPHVVDFVRRVSKIFGAPLTIIDNSTHSENTTSGNRSDHADGNAADIPMTGAALTRLGQAALIAAGVKPAAAAKITGGVFNVGGVNILFNTNVGGNHFDHLHVGLKAPVQGGADEPAPVAVDGTAATDAGSVKSAPLIPNTMQLALARAEGSQGMKDDLTALSVIEKYLAGRLTRTKDLEKKLELQEALNSIRDRVQSVKGQLADAEKERQTKLDEALERMRESARDKFAQTIELLRARIVDRREGFAAAFGTAADQLAKVWDAKTDLLLANARAKVSAFGFEIGAGEETPAERALREFREQRAAEDRARRRAAATPEELAALDLEDRERALEDAAALERKAADEALAAERRRITDERALKREGFLGDLNDLQAHWATTNASSEQRMEELKALLNEYELPFSEVGSLVGDAFANSFLESLKVVFARLAELRGEMNAVAPQQAAEAAFTGARDAGLAPWEAALAARSAGLNARYGLPVPGFAAGVRNFPGGFALVGEQGPELVRLPGGSDVIPNHLLGGIVVNVTLPGAVLLGSSRETTRELARQLAPELAREIKQAIG